MASKTVSARQIRVRVSTTIELTPAHFAALQRHARQLGYDHDGADGRTLVQRSLAAAVSEAADIQYCRVCGCIEDDCEDCIEATGHPCWWVEADLCSACQ